MINWVEEKADLQSKIVNCKTKVLLKFPISQSDQSQIQRLYLDKLDLTKVYLLYTNNSNNPLKVCFSDKKYPSTIQTRPTQIEKVYFLLKNQSLMDF